MPPPPRAAARVSRPGRSRRGSDSRRGGQGGAALCAEVKCVGAPPLFGAKTVCWWRQREGFSVSVVVLVCGFS